jgi:hypothetical protein
MAAHTFELSPTWAPARPPAHAGPDVGPNPQNTDVVQASAVSSRRIAAAWILLPVAAVLAGLAALFIPSADNAAARKSAAATPPAAEARQAVSS